MFLVARRASEDRELGARLNRGAAHQRLLTQKRPHMLDQSRRIIRVPHETARRVEVSRQARGGNAVLAEMAHEDRALRIGVRNINRGDDPVVRAEPFLQRGGRGHLAAALDLLPVFGRLEDRVVHPAVEPARGDVRRVSGVLRGESIHAVFETRGQLIGTPRENSQPDRDDQEREKDRRTFGPITLAMDRCQSSE